MKHLFKNLVWLFVSILALALGAGSNVIMADASALPDAGKTVAGDGVEAATNIVDSGIATVTSGKEEGDENFILKDVDAKIMKIRPMSTPVENISRGASSKSISSMVAKYYSIGTRPVRTTLTSAVTAQTAGESVVITVADGNIFTVDDTIRVVGVKGTHKENGSVYAVTDVTPDLMLKVTGISAETGMPAVYAVNGNMNGDRSTWVPAIPSGTTLVRMGKACAEIDAQTGEFTSLPTAEEQYCQNFMLQIEESTFNKLSKKEVDWTFSDMEEEAVYDMKLTRELTYLFGVKNVIKHPTKKNQDTYFMGGIWWMAGKDIEVGKYIAATGTVEGHVEISDEDLVDITKDLFVGCASSGRKVMFCGSEMLQALSKIKSEKFRLKDTVEVWNLKFKSWQTDFGEILTIHHELFNECGMSDYGFAIEPDYLEKKVFVPYTRSVKDFKSSGIRNTEGVVIQEVCCMVLKNAKAHARMRLAQKPA